MKVETMTKSFESYFMKQFILLIGFLFLVLAGCSGDSTSLYDPNYEANRPDPSISVIEPDGGWIAGVDTVIIRGENFSDQPEENRVYFGGVPGIIHSATQTELKVRPARVVGEQLPVKMAVRYALNFSNVIEYTLDQAVTPVPGSRNIDNSLAIATDSSGDIYFLNQEEDTPRGIRKWDTGTNANDQYLESRFDWTSLKIGPDGLLYAARNIFGIYRETPSATIDNNPFAVGNSGEAYRDIDFDPDHNLWAVGNNENIFRIDIESGSVERFEFDANLRAVRYYEGKLYMGGRFDNGTDNGSIEIWTMDINNGLATNPQQYLKIDEVAEIEFTIYSITFDEEGTLYLGTDAGTGIYTWNEANGFNEFYPGLIEPDAFSLAWTGEFLIASATNRGESTRHPLKIDVRKQGAPYYGIE